MMKKSNLALTLFLFFQILPHPAHADELKLFFYHSFGIDWRDPNRLAKTIVRNSINGSDYSLGHAAIELTCEATASEGAFHEMTGMTMKKNSEANTFLLIKGGGLGAMFYNYRGKLQTADDVAQDNEKEKTKNGKMRYLAIDISSSTCRRLAKYVTEYRAYKHYENYGLPNSPRYAEGAGCSAFATSFLDLAGLKTPEIEAAWSMTKAVPAKLVGGPLTGKRVSLLKLLVRSRANRQWAKDGEQQFVVKFYEPDTMFRWVDQIIKTEEKNPSGQYQIERSGKIAGIRWDARSVPTPTDPIWKVQP